jgi:hypothetical protein
MLGGSGSLKVVKIVTVTLDAVTRTPPSRRTGNRDLGPARAGRPGPAARAGHGYAHWQLNTRLSPGPGGPAT